MSLLAATLSSVILGLGSFLQPGNLEGCGTFPRPSCTVPDVPELEARPRDRQYMLPLTNPRNRLDVTFHYQPGKYGQLTDYSVLRHYCFVDEAKRTADCYTAWEYQTVVYCSVKEPLWIARFVQNGQVFFVPEEPESYWTYRRRTQVYLWEFEDRVTSPPFMPFQSPPPRLNFQVDRIQTLRLGEGTVSFPIRWVLLIKEADTPMFIGNFELQSGPSGGLPPNAETVRSCSASYVFTSYCDIAPFRPECRPNN